MDARVALRSALAPLAACALLAGAAPAAADSAPELRSAKFSKPAIVGRTATLRLRAVDKERSVTGAVVAFAGEGAYGTSACRPGSDDQETTASGQRRRRPQSGPGRPATISVPHRFRTVGPRAMLVRVDTAGCTGGGGVLLQPFTVTPVAPGEPPQEPVASGSPIAILGSLTGGVPSTGNGGGVGGSGVELPPGVTDPAGALPNGGGLPSLPPAPKPPETPLPDAGGVTGPLPTLPLAHAAQGCADADLVPTESNAARVARATVCLLNDERRRHGLRRLRLNRRMSRAARAHSVDMVARNYFGHIAPDGVNLVKRLVASRWLPRPPGWAAGENIAFGETPLSTPRATVAGWQASSGHRENDLDPIWRLAGIGVVPTVPGGSPLGGATYTAVFGR